MTVATLIFSVWLLLCFVSPMVTLAQDCFSDAWGTEFYLGIPGNDDGTANLVVNLQILAERPGKVTVSNSQFASEVFSSTRNVSKGITTIQIPSTLVHNPSYSYMYQNKGLRIISSVDVSVIVTMNLGISNMFDSMLLLPTVVLSTEYVVLYSGEKSTLIAGIESNTHFQIRCQTVNGPSGVLGQYQTYLLHNGTASDTFSCSIFSTKPIAVFLSGFGHSIWTGLEQAIPVSNWGKQYVIPEIHTDHSFQILASQNDTFINIDTSPPLHIIAQSGQLRQSFVYKSSLFLDSNQPIMTLEYKTGFQGFLTTIPAVNQFGSRYVFYVPDVKGDGYEHYVTVIFETDGFGGFVFDEVYIPAWIDKSSTGKYTVATFQVFDPGYHVITVTKEEAFGNDMLLDVFGGIVYGYNPHSSQFTLDAYAHPLGMVLSTGKPGCTSKNLSSRRANPATKDPHVQLSTKRGSISSASLSMHSNIEVLILNGSLMCFLRYLLVQMRTCMCF